MKTRKYTSLPYIEEWVASGRFDTSRATIDRIVLHTTVGSAQAAINTFGSTPAPGKETSAHYLVKKDGGLIALLEEYYTAYHCGNYGFNQRSIGIEHEDGGDYDGVRPDALYKASAQLVADICRFYNIPCDRDHIFRHRDVPGASTACPDALNTDRIIREAQLLLNPQPTPPMANTQDEFKKVQKLFEGYGKPCNEAKDVDIYVQELKKDAQTAKQEKGDKETELNNLKKAVTDTGLAVDDVPGSLNKMLAEVKAQCETTATGWLIDMLAQIWSIILSRKDRLLEFWAEIRKKASNGK